MSFPVEHMPVSDLIRAASAHQNFPIEITAAGVLSAVSLSLGNNLSFENPAGYSSKCNVWIAIVAPRGTAKTHALERCLKPISDYVTKKHNTYEKEMEAYEAAEILGISRMAIYGLVNRQKIPYCKIGKYLYFSRYDLDKWIRSGEQLNIEEIRK